MIATELIDPAIGLAAERTELALERTQLAWIRTMFTFITGGLAIDKGLRALHQSRLLSDRAWVHGAHGIGIGLTAAGTLILIAATTNYVRRSRELAEFRGIRLSFLAPPILVSGLVIALGATVCSLLIFWG
jgi:putative membrane protein